MNKGILSSITTGDYVLFLISAIADRALKICALFLWQHNALKLRPWLFFSLEKNIGLAWGLGATTSIYGQYIFSIIMLLALLFVLRKAVLNWCKNASIVGEVLILVGGTSNLLDRVFYGSVIDFIQIFIGNYRLSVFNLADVYIAVGLYLLFRKTSYDSIY